MSLLKDVPIPAWVMARQTPESVDHAKLCFYIRLAALYHNEKSSVSQLSSALGLSETTLHQVLKRGEPIQPTIAVEIEKLIGRSLFPRELFRPDLFVIPE